MRFDQGSSCIAFAQDRNTKILNLPTLVYLLVDLLAGMSPLSVFFHLRGLPRPLGDAEHDLNETHVSRKVKTQKPKPFGGLRWNLVVLKQGFELPICLLKDLQGDLIRRP
jgi:hypothetical protein